MKTCEIDGENDGRLSTRNVGRQAAGTPLFCTRLALRKCLPNDQFVNGKESRSGKTMIRQWSPFSAPLLTPALPTALSHGPRAVIWELRGSCLHPSTSPHSEERFEQ
ncbi:hypothetical protein N7465_004374 [Penicillium sp. CMV-2018d]|nr:hypothetical protein N7465_004374 [Penicillium sp. CMV-2018d]